jgi:hypothetical protein
MGEAYPFTAVYTAAAGCFLPALVDRLQSALQVLRQDDSTFEATVTFAELGQLLALALPPDTVAVGGFAGPQLRSVILSTPARTVTLTDTQALAHPVVRDWIAPTLAETFAMLISGAADLSILARGAPTTWACVLSDAGGVCSARIDMSLNTYADLAVIVHYGAEPPVTRCTTTRTLDGAALVQLANSIIDLTQPAPSGSLAEAAQVAVATCEADVAPVH